MDFGKVVSELSAMGYKRAAARAKIAHDVVLAAIDKIIGYEGIRHDQGWRCDEWNNKGRPSCDDGYGR